MYYELVTSDIGIRTTTNLYYAVVRITKDYLASFTQGSINEEF
jgi:hypothetical protein